MKNLIVLIILTFNFSLLNAKSFNINSDSIQEINKLADYDSYADIDTVNPKISDNLQIRSAGINDNNGNYIDIRVTDNDVFTLVQNDFSSQDGLTVYLNTIMNTFRTGFSIWNSESNKSALNHSTLVENNYKVKLSIGTNNRGAGLKFTF